MLSLRDRFIRYFQGESDVALPFMYVFGPMRETALRWREQGMTDEHQWFHDVGFEGEPGKQFGNRLPVNPFVCPAFAPEVLEEGEEYVIRVNAWGTVDKVRKDGKYMPYPVGYPVKDRASWGAMKERLRADTPERFPANWDAQRRACDQSDTLAYVGGLPCGFFGAPRELFGVENWLMCFYDDPALAHEVLDTLCDLWCELFGRVASEARVDFHFIWEDMCFRGGPLVSPVIFREFMLPRYQRLTQALRDAGVPLMMVDTDGNCDKLTPLYIEGGVDIVFPFEVQSGMDVAATRRQFPELGIIGGVEKTMPSQAPEVIDAEFARLQALLAQGRYLPCSDHGVPPTVRYDEYVSFYRGLGNVIPG